MAYDYRKLWMLLCIRPLENGRNSTGDDTHSCGGSGPHAVTLATRGVSMDDCGCIEPLAQGTQLDN